MVNPKYKALLRVAETGSFTQAANDLGYSQSGISGMISSLEKEMGVQLVVRDYGEAHLSAEGEDLLPWISNVCNGERQLASRIAELRRLERGAVRVAAPTSISTHWFPGMVKAFERKCPGVELHLMCIDDEAELERALWHGDADCGFLVAPAKRALKAIPLHDDPIMVLLPPDHALAHADHVPARTLAEEPFIQPRSRSMQEAEALLRNSGVKPRVRFAVDSDYNVMNMVSKGLGFSILPGLLLEDTVLPLAVLPLAVLPPHLEMRREISIAMRSADTSSAATRAFVQTARTWVAQRYEQR